MSNGFTYTIGVNLKGLSALDKAVQVTNNLNININHITVSAGKAGTAMDQAGKKGKSAFDSASSGVAGLLSRLGLVAGVMKSLDNTAAQDGFESAITFASGSALESQKNLAFFRDTVDALGQPLKASQEGFKTLMGSINGTNISMDQGRSLFLGMASASTTLKMRGEQSELALKALGQIASKGKVSMEELRGQLGDHLPGALNIAARAMGVSQAKFQDMVRDGIEAEVFLPKFAAELNKTFGRSALDAANSPTAMFNRMKNSLYDLSVTIGTQLMPTALSLIQNFLIPGVTWIGQNINMIGLFAVAAGSAWVAVRAWGIIQKGWTVIMAVSQIATGLMTGSIWKMNAALLANPIGIVIGLVAGLTAGIIYAWNKFEGFRGFLVGSFFSALELFKSYAQTLLLPFKTLGRILAGVFTGDWKAVKEGIKGDVKNIMGMPGRVKEAWNKGWDKGTKMKGITLPGTKQNALGSAFVNASDMANAGGATAGGSLGDTATSQAEGITGDGKGRNVTINIEKFFDQITIQTIKAGEGVDEMVDMVVRKLVQAVNTANQVQ